MKILYGIQGTGNGHIARARQLGPALENRGATVDYVFSGRPKENYFDMEAFHNARYFKGLTFATDNGKISTVKTLKQINAFRYISDVSALHPERYDLVITDFEPVTAWAAKRKGIRSIGIAHQYAFRYKVPSANGDPMAREILRWFAPADQYLGLHWDSFGQPILPPIIDTSLTRGSIQNYTLVYLPFHDLASILQLLHQLPHHQFIVFSPDTKIRTHSKNVIAEPLSYKKFKQTLLTSSRIICSSGFELISEAIHLGIPVLCTPVAKQFEQISNALALERLALASCMDYLDLEKVKTFIEKPVTTQQIPWPNVAEAIADFTLQRQFSTLKELSEYLWSCTKASSKQVVSA